MDTILRQMKIPLDEYWVAVGLAGYRSLLNVYRKYSVYRVCTGPS